MRWLGFSGLTVLITLLLLPVLSLFVAQLAGYEPFVNQWLQNRLGLSYHAPLTQLAMIVLLLLPPLLILLYFLKLRRRPLAVSSTLLWRKSIEDLHVNSLFQWLRRNILLLLQLLILACLLLALLAPRLHGRGGTGKHYVLMIDRSASMNATDVADTRLQAAQAAAIREIDAVSDSDSGMVIAFSDTAEILQSFTNNRGLLRAAVRSVKPSQRPTRIDEALALADSLANPRRSLDDAASAPADAEPGKERTYVAPEGVFTEVHLFSDGRFHDLPEFSLGNIDLKFHSIGSEAAPGRDNLAIVNFSALRDENDPANVQLYVRVMNYRTEAADVDLEIELQPVGKPAKLLGRSLSLPARQLVKAPAEQADMEAETVRDLPGEATAVFALSDLDDAAGAVAIARLQKHHDSLAADDRAFLVLGVVRKADLLIITAGNPVLKAFFDDPATALVANVTWLTPEQISTDAYRRPAREGRYDLIIFDRCAPANVSELPLANTLFIGEPPPPWKRETLTIERNPFVKGWSTRHPAMRFLGALHEIGIGEAFRLDKLPPRTPLLLEGDRELPLLAAISRESFTDLVLAFPILNAQGQWNTNWPLQPSFPLWLRNLLYEYGYVRDAAGEENTRPGEAKTLRPGGGVSRLTVTAPDGTSTTLERGSRADFVATSTDQIGLYQVSWKDSSEQAERGRRFAVNLFDGDESRIDPRPTVQVGATTVTATEIRGQPRELWKWAILAALAVLMLEWWIYNKRVYV